jgi:ketosteroid isomerase-like protein
MAHPNEENLRKGYEAFGRGDIDTVMTLLTDDIQWHVPGRNPLSRDYSGKEEVGGFFAKMMELTDGTFRVEVHDVLANDEHGVGLLRLSAQRDGKTLQVNDVHVWHVRDGKFSEFWAQPSDQYGFDEFWD